MNEAENEYVELHEHRAMIYLPEDAVEIEINAKIYHDGKLETVSRTISMSELREAFRKADDGYIDEDDRFTLTENGKAWLERMWDE